MRINIVIAEDHKLFRQGLVKLLDEYNIYTLDEADNGLQLLNILQQKKPDIVLLDIEMPVMNGCDAFYQIKKIYPDQKIIFLSTHNEKHLIEHLYLKGADGFLAKNTDIEAVVETIRLVHADKTILNPTQHLEENKTTIFSKRESEVTSLICEGKSNKEIAGDLKITSKTVEAHKKNLFKKTQTRGVVSFVSHVLKNGLNYIK